MYRIKSETQRRRYKKKKKEHAKACRGRKAIPGAPPLPQFPPSIQNKSREITTPATFTKELTRMPQMNTALGFAGQSGTVVVGGVDIPSPILGVCLSFIDGNASHLRHLRLLNVEFRGMIDSVFRNGPLTVWGFRWLPDQLSRHLYFQTSYPDYGIQWCSTLIHWCIHQGRPFEAGLPWGYPIAHRMSPTKRFITAEGFFPPLDRYVLITLGIRCEAMNLVVENFIWEELRFPSVAVDCKLG